MKAFEAKTQTSQAQYEIIMKKINNSITKGNTYIRIENGKEISEKAIQKIAKDGFDVEINDMSGTIFISWENSEEGRVGVITKKVKPVSTFIPRKKSFLERIFGDCSFGEGDGDW